MSIATLAFPAPERAKPKGRRTPHPQKRAAPTAAALEGGLHEFHGAANSTGGLSRRNVLQGAAAAAVLPAGSPANAAVPQIGRQAPGFYRYKVGSIEITVVNDGVSRMPITEGFVSQRLQGRGERRARSRLLWSRNSTPGLTIRS